MVMRWRSPFDRRGASSLGCLFSLLVFVGALYYGVNIGELFFRYYRLLDEMQSQAQLAPSLDDGRGAGHRGPSRGPADPNRPSRVAAGDRDRDPILGDGRPAALQPHLQLPS